MKLTYRKATLDDLSRLIELLLEDDLGQYRESKRDTSGVLDGRYIDAFHRINDDPHQYLMVVENENKKAQEIVGMCHLTLMPSLTFMGSSRLQIEAVRVCRKYRGKKIGQWMINQAIEYGKSVGAFMIQLTTNKTRESARRFYEACGFEATHEGMKRHINT